MIYLIYQTIKSLLRNASLVRKELCVFSASIQYLLHIIEMLPINSKYNKLSCSIYHDKKLLKYHVNKESLNDIIYEINQALYNASYKLSLSFDEPMDYIDLSLIKDNAESITITYNSNHDMNKTVMISCKDKQNLKEIILNFNTQEKICCGIINCPSNITIHGGNNALTYIKTKIIPYNWISIRGYNTNSICVSDSTMTKLELEKIEDLTLNKASYIKNGVRIGPITKDIGPIKRLSIEDIETYI